VFQDPFFGFCVERARDMDIKDVNDAKAADWAKLFLNDDDVKCNLSTPLLVEMEKQWLEIPVPTPPSSSPTSLSQVLCQGHIIQDVD